MRTQTEYMVEIFEPGAEKGDNPNLVFCGVAPLPIRAGDVFDMGGQGEQFWNARVGAVQHVMIENNNDVVTYGQQIWLEFGP